MVESGIEIELRHISERLGEIVAWQASHSGEGHSTTHSTLVKRMDDVERDMTKAKTVWWVIAGAFAGAWTALLAWWKS